MKTATITRPVALLAGAMASTSALAEAGPGGRWGHPGMMWGGGWIMGPLMMLLVVALIVAVVVLVVRWLGGDMAGHTQHPSSSARRILEERFARGEIDEEEFRKRRKALEE